MSATVTYKGATLTTVSNTTKVLETAGMLMEDDVTITDVTGSAPVLETVARTYTPTTSTQSETVTPSAGYTAISSIDITVNPIPSNYGLITYNGSIITVS